jgi:hypothetical protein
MIYTLTIKSSDESDIKTTLRAREYLSCLREIAQEIEKKKEYSEEESVTWTEIHDTLWVYLRESNIDPFDE